MKKVIEKYKWLLFYISAGFILTMSIVLKIVPETLYYLTGIILIIFGIFRVVPLFKSNEGKIFKLLYLLEMAIEIIIGIIFIYIGIKNEASSYFGLLLGFVLYARGFIYFLKSTMTSVKNSFPMFIIHIITLTFGTVIFTNDSFTIKDFSWFMLIIGIICGLLIIKMGYSEYKKFMLQKKTVENSEPELLSSNFEDEEDF